MIQSNFIPGVLFVETPRHSTVPLILDSPHSGSMYPADFGASAPRKGLRRTEDMYVDELFADAPRCGASLLGALFPRSYIDPNRAESDLDPALLAEPWPRPLKPSRKSEIGVGLVWRYCPPGNPVYDRKLSIAEIMHRIERFHRPYHAALKHLLEQSYRRFGAVWHINCHSMMGYSNSFNRKGPRVRRPDITLGDRDGTACAPEFTAFVRAQFEAMGYEVKVNKPYRGVELIRAYSDPATRRHSLMIEINRTLYMDELTFAKHSKFATLRADLAKLVAAMAAYVREQISNK